MICTNESFSPLTSSITKSPSCILSEAAMARSWGSVIVLQPVLFLASGPRVKPSGRPQARRMLLSYCRGKWLSGACSGWDASAYRYSTRLPLPSAIERAGTALNTFRAARPLHCSADSAEETCQALRERLCHARLTAAHAGIREAWCSCRARAPAVCYRSLYLPCLATPGMFSSIKAQLKARTVLASTSCWSPGPRTSRSPTI